MADDAIEDQKALALTLTIPSSVTTLECTSIVNREYAGRILMGIVMGRKAKLKL